MMTFDKGDKRHIEQALVAHFQVSSPQTIYFVWSTCRACRTLVYEFAPVTSVEDTTTKPIVAVTEINVLTQLVREVSLRFSRPVYASFVNKDADVPEIICYVPVFDSMHEQIEKCVELGLLSVECNEFE